MSEKQSFPVPGDTIVCNNGKKFICVEKENYPSLDIYPDYKIYAVKNPQNPREDHMCWKENDGNAEGSVEWSIREVISKTPEKELSPAEKAGFVIGELYECIKNEGSGYYVKGNIYRFQEDDDSRMPWFVPYKEHNLPKFPSESIAIFLEHLKPYIPENTASRHKWADEIIAWANGATIQVRYKDDPRWHDVRCPAWSEAGNEYRVKPKPDAVIYTIAEIDEMGQLHTSFSDTQSSQEHNLKLTFDVETGKLKAAEVIN